MRGFTTPPKLPTLRAGEVGCLAWVHACALTALGPEDQALAQWDLR